MRVSFVVSLLLAALAGGARADSWAPPVPRTIEAADGSARVTVVPRGIASPLAFHSDKVDGREPAGQKEGAPTQASATLERRAADGRWTPVWTRPLLNEVAPVDVLVAPDGARVVTLDNWHHAGYGDDAVVIYDDAGEPLRAYSVAALVGEAMFRVMPRSVSSIGWREEATLSADGRELLLRVVFPSGTLEPVYDDVEFLDLRIDLATATPVRDDGEEWRAARALAERTVATAEALERGDLAAWSAPLRSPSADDFHAWAPFLREAYARVDEDWDSDEPYVRVLRAADDPRHAASLAKLREAIGYVVEDGGTLMIAAADADTLAADLETLAADLDDDALAGVRLYVAASRPVAARIGAALAHTGPELRRIDPESAIPQRPERRDPFGTED